MRAKRLIPEGFADDARRGMLIVDLAQKYQASVFKTWCWLDELGIERRQGGKKPVEQIHPDTGELVAVFPSMADAGRKMYGDCLGNAQRISLCCTGKAKTACGYVWRYAKKVTDNAGT